MHLYAVHAVAAEPRAGTAAQGLEIDIGALLPPMPAGNTIAGNTSLLDAMTPPAATARETRRRSRRRSSGR